MRISNRSFFAGVLATLVLGALLAFAPSMAVTDVTGHPKANGTAYAPAHTTMAWATAIAATGADDLDNAAITNPTTQITGSTRYLITIDQSKKGAGNFICFRLAYDDGLTSITNPVIAVFGRESSSDTWMRLPNRAGGISCTLTTAVTDVTDGTLCYTMPDPEEHVFERGGCEQFLIGTEVALAGTGTTSNAIVQYKFR